MYISRRPNSSVFICFRREFETRVLNNKLTYYYIISIINYNLIKKRL